MAKIFDYFDEPPGLWPELLKRFHTEGHARVRCRVSWGAHETVRGMRDFSKVSRLRLEKLLTLAQAEGLGVEIELGFSRRKGAFPTWVWEQSRLGRVPRGGWEEECSPFESISTPTLFFDEVRHAFQEFVDEARTLLDLYQAPEGPLHTIEFSPGPLKLEQGALGWETLESSLTNRFKTVTALNDLFQTNFRSFNAACTPTGQKTLWDRRPWLFAWQLQQVRAEAWREKTAGLPSEAPLVTVEENVQYLIDETLVDTDGRGRYFPFQPVGQLSEASLQWFRLADYLSARHPTLRTLAQASATTPAVVFCGKYLSRATLAKLPQDRPVLFPALTPQYDENMVGLSKEPNWISRPVESGNRYWESVVSTAGEVLACP